MKTFIFMTQLMTRIPFPLQVEVAEEDLGRGNLYFPLIGAIIGVILAGAYCVFLYVFGEGILAAVLCIGVYLWITGGLHMDGLSDTFDGMGSNRSRERVLEIMKDSRVGVFGVLILVFTLLVQVAAVQRLAWHWAWIVAVPMLGRYGCVFGNSISTYARTEGMGKYFVTDCTWREWILTSLYIWPAAFLLLGLNGLVATGIVLGVSWVTTRWVQRRLGGITGDVIGAVIELCQLAVLLLAVIFVR